MGAVWMLARSDLRRRWRSVIALTLLVGVAGAVVLALVAGARRTNTSLERFESYSRSADLEVTVGFPKAAQLRAFERSPGVKSVGRVYSFALLEQRTQQYFPLAAQMDRTFGTTVDRPVVVKGRLADQRSPDEIVVGEALAQQLHLGLGDRLHFDSYTPDQIQRGLLGDPLLPANGPKVALRVVGVVRRPLDLGGRGAPVVSSCRRRRSWRSTATSSEASPGNPAGPHGSRRGRCCARVTQPPGASSGRRRSSRSPGSGSRARARRTRST